MTIKGVFATPRSLGTVSEIAFLFAQIRLESGGKYEIASNIGEGKEQEDGTFLSITKEIFHLKVEEFSVSEKRLVNNFLRLLIKKYANYKEYSGLTIS